MLDPIVPRPSCKESVTAEAAIQEALSGKTVSGKEISGEVKCANLTFPEYVKFSNCCIRGQIDLSGCQFQRGVEFIGCEFAKSISMESCRSEGDFHIRACVFIEEARFERLQVNGKLEVRAPRNNAELADPVFRDQPWVRFNGFATFSQIHVLGEANFGSAQFESGVDFYNASIEGPVFFRKDYCKAYKRAQDEAKRRMEENSTMRVDPLEVDPSAFPDDIFPHVHFKGDRIRFRDAYFGGELNFHAAEFDVLADFSYAKCMGVTFFCESEIPTETKLPCKFHGGINFEGAQFSRSALLHRAAFSSKHLVNFYDCRIADTLSFFDTLPEHICLTGCSYKRLRCGDYDRLEKVLKEFDRTGGSFKETEQPTFDRSSWVQLESTLRNEGEIKRADKIYRTRMGEERIELPSYQQPLSIIWGLIAGYGTETWKLTAIGLLVFLVGVPIFYAGHLETNFKADSRSPGDARPDETCQATGKWQDLNGQWQDLTKNRLRAATGISLFQFSPVKLPIGDDCLPSGRSQWFAVFERLTGWILVPLLVANLAGLLHRKTKSNGELGGGDD